MDGSTILVDNVTQLKNRKTLLFRHSQRVNHKGYSRGKHLPWQFLFWVWLKMSRKWLSTSKVGFCVSKLNWRFKTWSVGTLRPDDAFGNVWRNCVLEDPRPKRSVLFRSMKELRWANHRRGTVLMTSSVTWEVERKRGASSSSSSSGGAAQRAQAALKLYYKVVFA